MHKCDNCFYRTDWDGGICEVQYPICEREWWKSFEECKTKCEKPGECEFKESPEENRRRMLELLDEGVKLGIFVDFEED